ncbi:MAG TPA: acetyl-CoA carboxylase biotin carboxyl carrier protein, partial [Gaiellaceae bacterium]|nr:acetyl-CoA carboxylase biotin carboxyl carrier protein [Gaiellaceae bacterium]
AVDQGRAERIRELVRIVQESGVAEIAVEEAGMRVSVRRREEPEAAAAPNPVPSTQTPSELEPLPATGEPATDGLVRVEAPMVGTFYRAASPGAPPFVEEGAAVASGQTLCILEAMKLMNEIKAELDGIVRRIHAANGDPVEFGQLLFEIEPVLGRPLDAV